MGVSFVKMPKRGRSVSIRRKRKVTAKKRSRSFGAKRRRCHRYVLAPRPSRTFAAKVKQLIRSSKEKKFIRTVAATHANIKLALVAATPVTTMETFNSGVVKGDTYNARDGMSYVQKRINVAEQVEVSWDRMAEEIDDQDAPFGSTPNLQASSSVRDDVYCRELWVMFKAPYTAADSAGEGLSILQALFQVGATAQTGMDLIRAPVQRVAKEDARNRQLTQVLSDKLYIFQRGAAPLTYTPNTNWHIGAHNITNNLTESANVAASVISNVHYWVVSQGASKKKWMNFSDSRKRKIQYLASDTTGATAAMTYGRTARIRYWVRELHTLPNVDIVRNYRKTGYYFCDD